MLDNSMSIIILFFACDKYQCLSDHATSDQDKLLYEQQLTNCLLREGMLISGGTG